jgi:hypothetical protein
MSTSIKHLRHGPTWFEVSLGAALSVVLGVVLGAGYLASRPVKIIGDIPKDAPPGTVYYVQGVRGYYATSPLDEKRRAFVAGESVTLDEAELNVLFGGPVKPPPPPLPANVLVQPPPPPPPKEFDKSPVNVRIHDGKIQFSDTYTVNKNGFTGTMIVQVRGEFVKIGSTFEFVPDVFYAGSCPLQRIPFVREWLMKELIFTDPIPEDLAAAWTKLSDVTIEGSKLRLKMP